MILNGQGWHYLKKLSALLREITPQHLGDFYCLNCLHLCRKKKKFEKLCKNKDFYGVVMPCEDTKILEFNQY